MFIGLLIILAAFSKSYGQIDLTRYYNPGLPVLVMDDHMKIDFAWKMKGNLQALINEGINSLDEDRITVALVNLNKAIQIDSTLWMSYYYRGICYKKMQILDSAEYNFLSSIALNSGQAEAYIELAEIYIAKKQIKKAERALDQAIEKNPTLPQSYYNQAAIAFFEGNTNKARKLYKKANEVGPKYPDAYLMQGLLTAYRSNTKEALELIGKAIEVDPTYSTGYFWRGMMLLQDNRIEECLNDWNNLIQYNPQNAMYAYMRGFLYIELKKFDKAFIDFKTALKAQDLNENKFTAKQSKLDKQIDVYAGARYLIANGYGLDETAFAFLQKGFCQLLIGQKKPALESFTHAENIQPSATVFFLKAIAFEHSAMHNEAMEYYTKALKRDNDIFDAHKKRSVYRMELEDWQGVTEDLDNMFRLEPRSPIAYRLRGLAKAHQKDYAGAVNDLSKFIESDSTDNEINLTRVTCYTLLGNREEAHRNITRLLKTDSANWILRSEMVSNYLVLKDTTQALAIIQEFTQIKPGYFIPYKRMAEIYILKKDLKNTQMLIEKIKPMISEATHGLDYSDLYLWEGLIAYYNNDHKEAISKFDKSIKRYVRNWDSYYWKAKAYEKAGQIKKALEGFKALADIDYRDSKACYQTLLKK